MSNNLKVQKVILDRSAVSEMLRSSEAVDLCKGYADAALSRLGPGYEVTTMSGRIRANAEIKAVTYQAEIDNLRNNTILKAVGGGDN